MTNHEQIILTEFDDGAGVLIDLQHKRYYQLNETALLIWRGLRQGLAMPQIITQITEMYDVSEAEITAHAAELLNDLAVRQLAVSA
jgi:Coenzyme PQQ synthesis protein D (PqqD)